jgi:hypothetical protein
MTYSQPLTSHLFPYQVELILLPPSQAVFEAHSNAEKIFGLRAKSFNEDKYVDDFWDTAHGDLHSNALTLRVRHRTEADPMYINYKGAPKYIHQLLPARLYGTVQAKDATEVQDFLTLASPSEPVQFMFSERPDLAGMPLRRVGASHVSVRARNLFDGERQVQVTITFHEYHLTVGAKNDVVFRGHLIEIQPTLASGMNLQRYIPYFNAIIGGFVQTGYLISPVGKYQRIPRESIDATLRQ